MSLLVAKAVTHAYRRGLRRRRPALVDVSLSVGPGECWGLLGGNGSGKSTLLAVLAGVTTPLAGDVLVVDRPAGTREARGRVGWVPESLTWPRNLRVLDVLSELASLSSARDIGGRVERAAEILDLLPLLGRPLGSLSHGQGRRVVLAQALLDDPPLLLLDEAFAGLDSLVLHSVRQDLSLRLLAGAGMVIATHRVDELQGLATHALVLAEGRVVASGPSAEVLDGAERPEVLARLLGAPA